MVGDLTAALTRGALQFVIMQVRVLPASPFIDRTRSKYYYCWHELFARKLFVTPPDLSERDRYVTFKASIILKTTIAKVVVVFLCSSV